MKMSSQKRALDKLYKRRDRYEIPEWQREEVWSNKKKQQLIDSILRGWKLPKFYFLKSSDERDEFEVVDGQQRLTTIFEFFGNELPLSKKSAKEFGGEYYRDLPEAYSDYFDDFEIDYDQIEESDDREIKEFFQRLQEGLPLTGSEKLNSVHSKLRDFAKSLSKHRFFREKVVVRDTRYAHFDIATKVAAIEIEGIDVGLRYEDLRQVYESQSSFSPNSNVAGRLSATFDYLDRVFLEKSALLKNRTVVQSFATLTAKIVSTGNARGYESDLRNFFDSFLNELSRQVELGQRATDSDYIRFQRTVNANVKSGARTRQEILLRKLLMFDPAFVDLFDPAVIAESGLSAQIEQLGESIITRVTDINSAYSSETGQDLFKPTNKTSMTLSRMGKSISDFSEYKTFIDDLYFLFHESVGNRLSENTPVAFKDVNLLRTELQHDLDHGKTAKVASKRKKIGETFKKYAGVSSPSTIAPEKFPAIQASILEALDERWVN